MEQVKKAFKKVDAIIWVLIIFFLIALIFVPGFATMNNFSNVLSQACVLLAVACGVHFAVLNGGVDFTSTSIIALSTVVGGSIMSSTTGYLAGTWYAIPVGILAMLLIGLVFGAIGGLAIVTFKMPSFIVTMALQMIGSGIAVVYTNGNTVSGMPKAMNTFGSGKIWIIPYTLIFALVVVVVTHVILSRTLFGRQLYAVGTNPKAALVSGISIKKTIFKVYVISGVCAACAGIIMLAQMQAGSVNYGSTMFNDIMGSIIVGGTSPAGGRGKIVNTAIGAFLITLIGVVFNLLNVPYYIITIVKGLIILVAGGIDIFTSSKLKH